MKQSSVFVLALCLALLVACTTDTVTAQSGPVATRPNITFKSLVKLGGGFIRMAYEPKRGSLLYMNAAGDIFQVRLDNGNSVLANTKPSLLHPGKEVLGTTPNCVTTGMVIDAKRTLYVTCNERVAGAKNIGRVRAGALANGSDEKRIWRTLMQTEPYPVGVTQFDHDFNGLAVSPDGRWLYVNSGSRTDHGEVQDAKGAWPNHREEPLTAAVFRIPLNSSNAVHLPNDLAQLKLRKLIYAEGTRNCYDLAFSPSGDLFCGENGPDADLVDELNWLREGRHYGFPWKFGTEDNPQASAKYDPSTDKRLPRGFFAVDNQLYKNDPSFPPRPSGIKFTDPVANTGPDADKYRKLDGREGDASQEGQPLLGITPHRSPLGLVFDSANALSGEYKGGLFMLSWGAAGGTLSDKGADLLLVRLTRKSDNYSASMTQIARNFALPIDAVLVNKTLYVLEFGGDGNIWAVQLP